MAEARDSWAAGSVYETFMGRWSRGLAGEFVSWLGIPRGAHWLDVGCGTGSLENAICDHAEPASVVGCDPSEAFVEFARGRTTDGRVSFVAAGVGSLPRRPGGYGSVTSLLALNFFPDAEAGIREMASVAARPGTVSACVWDYGGRMEFLRHFWDAATATDPQAGVRDEANRFPICQPDTLAALFRSASLADVVCEPIDIPTTFSSFADYWQPFLGGTGPAPSYVASLDDERRAALARELEAMLPKEEDGTIALRARAWAVRGTVPR